MNPRPRAVPARTSLPFRPLAAAAVLLAPALLAPAAHALDPLFWTGDKPFGPVNVHWVTLDGVPASDAAGEGSFARVDFGVSEPNKSLTFDGVNHPLELGDEVVVLGFQGAYKVSAPGNIKMTGTAAGFEFCNRDHDGDGLENCDEMFVYGTDRFNADTDGDGLNDGEEIHTYGTDPLDPDTDDGGTVDGQEIKQETDPLDPADDFHHLVWTQDGEDGARGAPIEVVWAQAGNAFLSGESLSGQLGDLRFDTLGDRWLRVNHLDVALFDGDVVLLEDFYGTATHTAGATGDLLAFDGHATKIVISQNETGELVHTYGRIMTRPEGTVQVDLRQEAGDTVLYDASHTVTVAPGLPVTYQLIDLWKRVDDPTTLGNTKVVVTPTESGGQKGYWVGIAADDPIIITHRQTLPLIDITLNVCVQFPEQPFICANPIE